MVYLAIYKTRIELSSSMYLNIQIFYTQFNIEIIERLEFIKNSY